MSLLSLIRFSGDVALLRVENSESWKLEKVLSGSHTDVVRSVLWDEEVRVLSSPPLISIVTELAYVKPFLPFSK